MCLAFTDQRFTGRWLVVADSVLVVLRGERGERILRYDLSSNESAYLVWPRAEEVKMMTRLGKDTVCVATQSSLRVFALLTQPWPTACVELHSKIFWLRAVTLQCARVLLVVKLEAMVRVFLDSGVSAFRDIVSGCACVSLKGQILTIGTGKAKKEIDLAQGIDAVRQASPLSADLWAHVACFLSSVKALRCVARRFREIELRWKQCFVSHEDVRKSGVKKLVVDCVDNPDLSAFSAATTVVVVEYRKDIVWPPSMRNLEFYTDSSSLVDGSSLPQLEALTLLESAPFDPKHLRDVCGGIRTLKIGPAITWLFEFGALVETFAALSHLVVVQLYCSTSEVAKLDALMAIKSLESLSLSVDGDDCDVDALFSLDFPSTHQVELVCVHDDFFGLKARVAIIQRTAERTWPLLGQLTRFDCHECWHRACTPLLQHLTRLRFLTLGFHDRDHFLASDLQGLRLGLCDLTLVESSVYLLSQLVLPPLRCLTVEQATNYEDILDPTTKFRAACTELCCHLTHLVADNQLFVYALTGHPTLVTLTVHYEAQGDLTSWNISLLRGVLLQLPCFRTLVLTTRRDSVCIQREKLARTFPRTLADLLR